jgi:hypothetical protein
MSKRKIETLAARKAELQEELREIDAEIASRAGETDETKTTEEKPAEATPAKKAPAKAAQK